MLEQSTVLLSNLMKEYPGNTIPGYCFTDDEVCSKISSLTHNCVLWTDPKTKCRNVETIGCNFAPGRDMSKELEQQKVRVGQQKGRRKRSKDKKVTSRTAGKTKGGNCVASPIQRYCAKYSRAYKHSEYAAVMASIAKRK